MQIRSAGPPLGGQSGNFISVRQKPDQDGGWGSLRRPKPIAIPLLEPLQLRTRLGYEAVPSSEFWSFELATTSRLQVDRISSDRYACCVGVALLDADNRRVAPLVQSASGRGMPVDVPAGRYTICASLGLPEEIKDLLLEVRAIPISSALIGRAHTVTGGCGILRRQPLLIGNAASISSGRGDLAQARKTLVALAPVAVSGQLHLRRGMQAAATVTTPATASLSSRQPCKLRAAALVGPAFALGRLAPISWQQLPTEPWKARRQLVDGRPGVGLNSAYAIFGRGELQDQALLLELQRQL